MKNARTALNDALQAAATEHPELKDETRIKHVFQVMIIALSSDESSLKSWDDVRGCAKEAVDAHLDASMHRIRGTVEKILLDIVDRAEKDTPTFVSPPPFQ